jgi:hypothetical protein
MKRISLISALIITFFITSCIPTPPIGGTNSFVTYIINTGEHYSNNNGILLMTNISEMKFIAKFDSSAIYTSVIPINQADIHKLYGFSDNNTQHHDNSARIGWRWFNDELQLLGYVYNNTVRSNIFIKSVPLNTEINCSIKIIGNKYIFTVDGSSIEMPRTSTIQSGYKLYPYFGGDEVAPHTIKILIKDL